jgi:hypothetical protein
MVEVTLHVHGKQPVNDLAASLSDLEKRPGCPGQRRKRL